MFLRVGVGDRENSIRQGVSKGIASFLYLSDVETGEQ